MTRRTAARTVVAALLAVVATGCATPESRIKKNPEAFAALPPEIQDTVRQGRIDIGYPVAAVELALGKPNRTYTRRTASASRTVWSYTSEYTTWDRQRVDARIRAYDRDGRSRTYTDWVWVDVEQKHEYERLRVEIENDAVIAIESVDR